MRFIFGMQVNIEVLNRHIQSTQNKKFAYLCNISKKNVENEVDFLLADKHEGFLQVDSTTSGVRSQACSKYSK